MNMNYNNQTIEDIKAINTILAPYGLEVNDVIKGSQVVRYKINLPLDVKTQGKIRRAANDIDYALSSVLKSNDVNFGKESDYLYIEKKSDFEPVIFENHIDNLPAKGLYLLLGKDLEGTNRYTNLSKAPHMLVAGTTGSGKSELLHTFIASLIYRRAQNPCRLILIDPKRAEFAVYKNRNGIDLITDMNQAINKLSWAVDEMETRYKILEQNKCKDIYELNDPNMYPYVIIIDEMADLLMHDKNAEKYIIRLAQKARACGIHLILGTQRPSREVVTGLIKANIPTRIALKTTDSMQSRIILDRSGADKLLGNGDMLFLGNGAFNPIRIQSAYVSQNTKEKIANALSYEEHIEQPTEKAYTSNDLFDYYSKQGYDMADSFKRLHETKEEPKKQKKVGLLKAFFSIRPIMFQTDEYPPRI